MSGSPRPAFLDSDSKGTGTLHMVHAILRAAAALLLSKLEELSGVDVEGLKGLGPDLKKQAVDGFAESAGSGGTLAQDFLGQFGQ